MSWTLSRVEKELVKISESKKDTFSIPVTINARLTKTLGRVFQRGSDAGGYRPDRMEFSKQFLETSADESIIDVIKHEWAHYYITKITGVNHKHDSAFKLLCSSIGACGMSTTKVERTVEVKRKYEMYCICCGKSVGGYTRMCKTLKSIDAGEKITSKCCGSKIRYEMNW